MDLTLPAAEVVRPRLHEQKRRSCVTAIVDEPRQFPLDQPKARFGDEGQLVPPTARRRDVDVGDDQVGFPQRGLGHDVPAWVEYPRASPEAGAGLGPDPVAEDYPALLHARDESQQLRPVVDDIEQFGLTPGP